MTNKAIKKIESRLLEIVGSSVPGDACQAAQALVDIYCQLEHLKLYKENRQREIAKAENK